MKPTLVTKDFTEDFAKVIKGFQKGKVLVGIPQEETYREGSDPINNATILAINEFGSPANNIPAWPVMSIGMAAATPAVLEIFKKGAQDALTNGIAALAPTYERAGIVASTSIKKTINAQTDAPELAEATLKARAAAGFKGTKRLIVTGQVRNAITYVVKGGL